jgi:hypothetical protein
MSNSNRKPNNGTGASGNPEILFDRPTSRVHPEEVLRHGILQSALNGETALFDVLPGIGKSRSAAIVADIMSTTILTNLTDNYRQYERWSKEKGVPIKRLPTRNLCPTLRDEDPDYPKDKTAKEARDARDSGWPVSKIHHEFDLPCQREEQTCSYREKLAEIDPDGRDTLLGHFTQGYNSTYLEGRVVVIDEECFDHYINEIKNPVEKAEKFLDTLDEFPFESARRPEHGEEQKRKEALTQLENEGLEPADHQASVGEFHAKAPLIAYAIIAAERMENSWLVANLPGDRTATFYSQPGRGSLHLFDPPDFSDADAVIALDATPSLSEWRRILGDEFNHYRLFDDDQRNQYLREQGYEFIQLNDYVWPVSGGDVSLKKCEAYLREVARKHGQRPDLITSKELLGKLNDENLEHLWRDDLHYGGFRGKNDLKASELLVVLGSPSRGDRDIQYLTALHGECAIPETDENDNRLTGYNLDYQSDTANEILETVRRGGVFQAAMRAGRTEDSEPTIYIATGMIPEWLDTKKAGQRRPGRPPDACTNLRSPGMKQVIEALREADGMSPDEFYDQVEIRDDEAKKYRQILQERGFVEKEGRTRGARYSDNGLENLNIAGDVDLGLSGGSTLENSIRGFPPKNARTDPIVPRRDRTKSWPENRYPGWMRDVQRDARNRKFDEQLNQRWSDQS